jgi:[histone H3]-lysine36 N-dimethyltransferase SETMAR
MQNLTNSEKRAIILHLYKKKYTITQTKRELVNVWGEYTPSVSTIHTWFTKFNNEKYSLKELEKVGRPVSNETNDNISLIKKEIDDNPNLSVRKLSDILGIPETTIYNILIKSLNLRKIYLKWVPHFLTPNQKQDRLNFSINFINRFDKEGSNNLYNVITSDETWLYFYDPKDRQSSKAWIEKGSKVPHIVNKEIITRKIMVSLFLSKAGILSWTFLPENRTADASWYTKKCLSNLMRKWKKVNSKTDFSKILMHYDNAKIHNSRLTRDYLARKKIKVLRHPPYSPDLAPCDFYIFNKIKNQLKGRIFNSTHQLKLAWASAVGNLSQRDIHTCFRMWFSQCEKCIQNNGDY